MKKYDVLKDTHRKYYDFTTTDQSRGVPMPNIEISPSSDTLIVLPNPKYYDSPSFYTLATHRRSIRTFSFEPMSIEELSMLLFLTQGVRQKVGEHSFRMVPSAGNRHPIETFLCIQNVNELSAGYYHYLPSSHSLELLYQSNQTSKEMLQASLSQHFVSKAPVIFFWAATPYRSEWRYGEHSQKIILLDAAHIAQQLYLACESLQLGTCAVAAYDQEYADELFQLKTDDCFITYLAPVGKL